MSPRQKEDPKFKIDRYDFTPGRVLAGKYEVEAYLGGGWEGEVYSVIETETGVERTAKFFFPQRNRGNRALRSYAQKLHRLRRCPILIQYHTRDYVTFRGHRIPFLISEYVEGELLNEFVYSRPGKRISPFEGIHLLHALASGMEFIHDLGDYHGDLHAQNIIVEGYGLRFDLKLVDLYLRRGSRPENIFLDVVDMITLLYEAVGGRKHYASQPPVIKEICCGLKHSLIRKKYRTAGQLRQHLESVRW